MKTFAKFLLFEIPQWFLLALILWILVETTDIPVWTVQGFFVIWVLKDIALFPLVRNAYENDAKTGTEQLIGVKATTQDRLDPEGFVKIQGVLWKARAEPDKYLDSFGSLKNQGTSRSKRRQWVCASSATTRSTRGRLFQRSGPERFL
jgi:membrane protein implicated in regulation of membrane protease activity